MGFFELFRPDVPHLASQQDVEGLIRALQYNDPAVVDDAARALQSCGKKIVPVILRQFPSADEALKCQLIQVLVTVDDIPVEQILPVIQDYYTADPDAVCSIFQSLSAEAVPFLIRLSSDKNSDLWELSIDALVAQREGSWPAVTEALSSPSHITRMSAADVLAQSGWKPHTEEEYVQFTIAKGDWDELARLKKSAVTPLIALLKDDYYGIRRDAAKALGAIGDPRAVLPLCTTLEDPDAEVCIGAIEALQNMRDRRALPIFVKILRHPAYNVRLAAAHALTNAGWTPATDTEKILHLIASEQWQALASMGKMVIPDLVHALGDDYYSIRQGAAETLRGMGAPGKNALVRACNDTDPAIRRTATDFLARVSTNQQTSERIATEYKKNIREQAAMSGTGNPAQKIQRPATVPGAPSGRGSASAPGPAAEKPVSRELPKAPEDKRPAPVRDAGEIPPVSPKNPEDTPAQKKPREFPDRPLPPVSGSGTHDLPGKTLLRVPDKTGGKPEDPDDRDLTPLIEALHHADENVRVIAIESLAKYGTKAEDPLISALSDVHYLVRSAGADALGRIHSERAVPALIGILDDPDESVRVAAALALGAIGDVQALVPLTRLLTDEYEPVRSAARQGLTGLGSSAIPFLLQLLGHENPQIRAGTATALGFMGARDACNPLAALFTDTDADVRESAALALGRIGTPSLSLLADALGSADAPVRLSGVTGLGVIGDAARELLTAACNDPDPLVSIKAKQAISSMDGPSKNGPGMEPGSTCPENNVAPQPGTTASRSPADLLATIRLINHPDKDVQIQAVTAIVQAGESAVAPLVDALLHEKNEVRAGAAEALVEIGSPSVMPLIHALKTPQPDAQIWILHALGKLGDRRAVEPISALLDETDPAIRMAATEALGYIGDASVVGRLAKIMSDPDEHMRTATVRALGYIGDPASAPYLVAALGDEECRVRDVAGEALFEIGTPALPALVEALKSRSRDIRDGAAINLERLDWEPTNSDERVNFLIAQESWMDLARMGADAIPPLSQALDNPDDDLRMGVVLTLGRMAMPETVGLLARVLIDRNVMIRQKATMALIDMGAVARQPLLTAGLDAPPALQQAIQQVIARIDRKVQS